MKKRKATRETKNMIQTALWLPREMHEQLKKEGGERGLGDEIRRRLQFSFDAGPPDKTTDELLDAINQTAIALDEPWYANRFVFDVFKAAIIELLSMCQPNGQAEPEAITKLQTSFGDEKPETIGRILARLAVRASMDRPTPFVDKQKG
jgi:hypothetical protein